MSTRKETKNPNERNQSKDIPLRVISIPDKEWKEYRKQAPQDELLVLGIGMKLWLAKTRKSALFFTLGLLLSVIVGILIMLFVHMIAGIAILGLGYLIFCTLCVRRNFVKTSLNQARAKLTADNKKALDAELKASGGAIFADVIISIVLLTLCEPYFLALGVLSAIIPSVLGTKLVIPEGFGFEALEEVKGYYAEKSFLSEAIDICLDSNRTDKNNSEPVTYKDEYGNEYEATTNVHGEKVYKDRNGNEYISNDDGHTIHQ